MKKEICKVEKGNIFVDVMSRVFDLFILNWLWLICSIPVITIGASTSAVYAVTLRMSRDENEGIIKEFFHFFKLNFIQATKIWLCSLLVWFVAAVDIYYSISYSKNAINIIFLVVAVTIILLLAICSTFLFQLQSRYKNTFKECIRNSFALAQQNISKMLLIWLIWIFPILLTMFVDMMPFMILFWISIGLGILFYATASISRNIFEVLELKKSI